MTGIGAVRSATFHRPFHTSRWSWLRKTSRRTRPWTGSRLDKLMASAARELRFYRNPPIAFVDPGFQDLTYSLWASLR